MEIKKISNIIKTKRKELKMTQEELAKKLMVTEKAVSRWETGRGAPDISLLTPLSKCLGISVDELLGGKEDSVKKIIDYIDTSKKIKSKIPLAIAITIYAAILFFYLLYLKTKYNPNYGFLASAEIIYNFIFIIIIAFVNRKLSNYYCDKLEDKNKIKNVTYICIAVIYIIMVFNLTLLGRFEINETRYNLIPLKTILYYFTTRVNFNIFVFNIFGNLMIYMPLEYIIIKLFKIKKFKTILPINVVIALSIELLQHITKTGIFDIDDIILNVIGMFIIYFITKEKE